MISPNPIGHGYSTTLLRVADLAKRYRDELAISGITFSVSTGEVLGVVGPNGAGKTTLLEAIAGLLTADSGAVFWRGEELPASRRREALFYLPEGIRPYQDRLVAEVAAFFAGVYRRSGAEVANAIAAVRMAPVLHK